MGQDFILYGMQASLYTGKARAYMRRNRIPVTERGAGHPEFMSRIFPLMDRYGSPHRYCRFQKRSKAISIW